MFVRNVRAIHEQELIYRAQYDNMTSASLTATTIKKGTFVSVSLIPFHMEARSEKGAACGGSDTVKYRKRPGVNKKVPITAPATAYPLVKSKSPLGSLNEYTRIDWTPTATVPIARDMIHLHQSGKRNLTKSPNAPIS